jgi:hypothetical protein
MPFGASYATLQEAWGTPSLKLVPVLNGDQEPRKEAEGGGEEANHEEEKHAKHEKHEKHDKEKGHPLPPHHSVSEERFENTMDRYDYDDRFQEYLKKRNRKSRAKPRDYHTEPASFPVIVEDFQGRTGDLERQYLNFALYVFSGIVLIFVMEQFIQIGLVIRGSK